MQRHGNAAAAAALFATYDRPRFRGSPVVRVRMHGKRPSGVAPAAVSRLWPGRMHAAVVVLADHAIAGACCGAAAASRDHAVPRAGWGSVRVGLVCRVTGVCVYCWMSRLQALLFYFLSAAATRWHAVQLPLVSLWYACRAVVFQHWHCLHA